MYKTFLSNAFNIQAGFRQKSVQYYVQTSNILPKHSFFSFFYELLTSCGSGNHFYLNIFAVIGKHIIFQSYSVKMGLILLAYHFS